ncbi:MAG: metallophosphoesterase family protein [Bdellovibrionia bacterium]
MTTKHRSLLGVVAAITLACGVWGSSLGLADSERATNVEIAEQNAAVFEVEPYLFAHGTGHIAVGWRYTGNRLPTTPVRVQTYLGNTQLNEVEAHHDGVSWSAELPVAECGFGNEVSYYLPGMSQRNVIAPIPCPDEHQPVRFSFIADAQEGPEFLEDIAKEISTFPGSAIFSGGDLVQEGAQMQDWFDYFRALQIIGGSRVTYAVIGNHEYRSDENTNYWQNFFRLKAHDAHYSTYLGGIHLMALNSNFEDDKTLVEPELEWLKSELIKPAQWKIVMFHHSPYSKGFFDGPGAIRKEHIVLRNQFVPLFEAYGVDVVLTGHTHIFERSVKDGIQYVVAGPAGGKMGVYGAKNPYSIHSFRERTVTHFEVNDQVLRSVTLSIHGEILDDFTVNHK